MKQLKRNYFPGFLAAVILAVGLAGCTNSEGAVSSAVPQTSSQTPVSSQEEKTNFKVGETAKEGDFSVTLVEATRTENTDGTSTLVCQFRQENNFDREITSFFQNYAGYADGEKLTALEETEEYPSMIKDLASGETSAGYLVFTLPAGCEEFTIEFRMDVFATNTPITFEILPAAE